MYSKNWSEVELKFHDRAFEMGNPNMLLLAKEHALEFIEECRERKIPISGIDGFLTGKDVEPLKGFTITEKSVQPIQDYSINFSLPPFKYHTYSEDEIYDQSTALIKKSPDHIYFEIGCDNTDE